MTSPNRRRMLGGPPALLWQVTTAALVLGAAFVGLCIVVASLALPTTDLSGPVGLVFVPLVFAGAVSYMAFAMRRKDEMAAGYTTCPNMPSQVVFCDWRTGTVLGEVGEPVVGWREFLRRRRVRVVRS